MVGEKDDLNCKMLNLVDSKILESRKQILKLEIVVYTSHSSIIYLLFSLSKTKLKLHYLTSSPFSYLNIRNILKVLYLM